MAEYVNAVSGDTMVVIHSIDISGNRVTKERIILRELTFSQGDTIGIQTLVKGIQRSKENLLNTALFNFVNIDTARFNENEINIDISLVERWYIWPVPIFEHAERNLGIFIKDPDWNRINYGGQINWNNFRGLREELLLRVRLGYKEQFSIAYNIPFIDRDQVHGVSLIFNQFRQHEINIGVINDEPVYLKNENRYLYENFGSTVSYNYRPGLYITQSVNFEYTKITYRDTATYTEYTGLDFPADTRYFSLEYIIEFNYLDSKYYPLDGKYLRLNLKQR